MPEVPGDETGYQMKIQTDWFQMEMFTNATLAAVYGQMNIPVLKEMGGHEAAVTFAGHFSNYNMAMFAGFWDSGRLLMEKIEETVDLRKWYEKNGYTLQKMS